MNIILTIKLALNFIGLVAELLGAWSIYREIPPWGEHYGTDSGQTAYKITRKGAGELAIYMTIGLVAQFISS